MWRHLCIFSKFFSFDTHLFGIPNGFGLSCKEMNRMFTYFPIAGTLNQLINVHQTNNKYFT